MARFGVHEASRSSWSAAFDAARASHRHPSDAYVAPWAEIGLASAALRTTRESVELFREALSVPRDALAEASASHCSASGPAGAKAEALVTRGGAVGRKCVPLGARRCATATRGAGSIEARAALVVPWEALVTPWEAVTRPRRAPPRSREARSASREDVATSSEALFALRAALGFLRSAGIGGRASPAVTAAPPKSTRGVLSASRGAPSAPSADLVSTRSALVIRWEALAASRESLVVRGDAPSVTEASLVTRREALLAANAKLRPRVVPNKTLSQDGRKTSATGGPLSAQGNSRSASLARELRCGPRRPSPFAPRCVAARHHHC